MGAGAHFFNDFAIQGHDAVGQDGGAGDARFPGGIFEAFFLTAAARKLIGNVLLLRIQHVDGKALAFVNAGAGIGRSIDAYQYLRRVGRNTGKRGDGHALHAVFFDTVTIGAVSGKVSRIQMRATTIIDGDQKELIVPNKTFITTQLVNWTLSDAITRIVIPVKIAYGSDVKLAHKVMMDTVRSTPLVLAEPEPSVLFVGFGDKALEFSIRIFVAALPDRMPATHDLHVRLEQALRENNIEIPH